jgi:predicted small secreted protein
METESRLKRVLIAAIITVGVTAITAAPGCNTIDGAGEDIESGGEAIQDAAD